MCKEPLTEERPIISCAELLHQLMVIGLEEYQIMKLTSGMSGAA